MISFHSFEDYDALHLLPCLVVALAKCEDETCRAVHGYAIEFRWLFWCVAVVFSPK
jgi:hypothetical protein